MFSVDILENEFERIKKIKIFLVKIIDQCGEIKVKNIQYMKCHVLYKQNNRMSKS